MYLSAATNRITVTWGNYGKVRGQGGPAELPREPCRAACSPPVPLCPPELLGGAVPGAADDLGRAAAEVENHRRQAPGALQSAGWVAREGRVRSLLGEQAPPFAPLLPSSSVNSPPFYLNRRCGSRARSPPKPWFWWLCSSSVVGFRICPRSCRAGVVVAGRASCLHLSQCEQHWPSGFPKEISGARDPGDNVLLPQALAVLGAGSGMSPAALWFALRASEKRWYPEMLIPNHSGKSSWC